MLLNYLIKHREIRKFRIPLLLDFITNTKGTVLKDFYLIEQKILKAVFLMNYILVLKNIF